jgi:hypothetical protein
MPLEDGIKHLHDRHTGLDQYQKFLIEGQQCPVVDAAAFGALVKKKLQRLALDLKDKETLVLEAFLQHSRFHRLEFPIKDFAV